jgi:hypothetical protein
MLYYAWLRSGGILDSSPIALFYCHKIFIKTMLLMVSVDLKISIIHHGIIAVALL